MKLKHFLYLPIAVLSTLAFTSCLDDDNGGDTEFRDGFLSVINAVPDTSALDFYIENVHLDDAPISFSGRYPDESYIEIAGPFQYNFTVTFPNVTSSFLLRSPISINPDVYYSIYVFNTAADDNVEGIMLIDDLESPAAGKAKVRFVHLGTDGPEVDLGAAGDTEAWFSDFAFKDASQEDEYVEVDAGIYDLEVREAGTATVLFNEPGVELENSKVYTLWIRGINDGAGQRALSLETIEHVEVEPTP
ncbi:MAG TPA: DUF4397 domain-containing protein [Anseongella sp.]|nr:DUF4397 domain-containing protein [Anseongella sp.]